MLEQKFARIATSIAKYLITKRTQAVVAEAFECLGGNGYVDESPLPRLYQDAPLKFTPGGPGQRPVPGRFEGDARGSKHRRSSSAGDRIIGGS
jgi:hypothetical protein